MKKKTYKRTSLKSNQVSQRSDNVSEENAALIRESQMMNSEVINAIQSSGMFDTD